LGERKFLILGVEVGIDRMGKALNQNNVFRSERDFGLMSFLVILMSFVTFQTIYGTIQNPLSASYTAVAVAVAVNSCLIWVIAGTRYKVLGDQLVVRKGPLSKTIEISEITEVAPSKTLIASPALSFNRLVINYRGGFVHISPDRREEFIHLLLSKNPRIVLNG
jgi:hypothetical protein